MSASHTSDIESINAELFDVVEGFSDFLIGHSGDLTEPVAHQREYLLLNPTRLLHLDYVPDNVLAVLHMNFEQLNSLALGLKLAHHLAVDYGLELSGPEVAALLI